MNGPDRPQARAPFDDKPSTSLPDDSDDEQDDLENAATAPEPSPNGEWRQVGPAEIFEPGRTFRVNICSGQTEVLVEAPSDDPPGADTAAVATAVHQPATMPGNGADTEPVAGTGVAAAALREVAARLARMPEVERELQQKVERLRLEVSATAMKVAIKEALEAESKAAQAQIDAEAERQMREAEARRTEVDPDSESDKPRETDEETIARLAKLAPLEYERQRDIAAIQLGISRVAILDRLVSAARGAGNDEKSKDRLQGHALELIEPEPWPDPVDGAALLDEVASRISRYVVLPIGASVAVALWCAHTFLLDAFRHTPRLAISSADPECGKTTLLDIVGLLIFRPLSTAGISSAALYRTIERKRPTFLADEADSYLHENEELRGCLNSGHKRGGQMIKCVGDDFEPRAFDVFCALAIAMIGLPPATVLSRSISIRMRRAAPGDEFEPFTEAAEQAFVPLVRKIARWAADNAEAVAKAAPDMPPQLVNRKGDNWRPLFLIAAVLGGGWPERLTKAAAALLAQAASDPQSLGVMALEDIRMVFHQRGNPDHLPSGAIVAELLKLEDRPWGALGKVEKPLTTNRLARLLAPYAIAPGTIWLGEGDSAKGYKRAQFDDAWKRYLRPFDPADASDERVAQRDDDKYPPPGGATNRQDVRTRRNPPFFPDSNRQDLAPDLTVVKPENPRKSATPDGLTDQTPGEGHISRGDGGDDESEALL